MKEHFVGTLMIILMVGLVACSHMGHKAEKSHCDCCDHFNDALDSAIYNKIIVFEDDYWEKLKAKDRKEGVWYPPSVGNTEVPIINTFMVMKRTIDTITGLDSNVFNCYKTYMHDTSHIKTSNSSLKYYPSIPCISSGLFNRMRCIQMTKPIFFNNNLNCLVEADYYCGHLCGEGRVYILEYENKRGWFVKFKKITWVS